MLSALLLTGLLAAPVIHNETQGPEAKRPTGEKKSSTKAPKTLLYRWRDKNGRIVISDKPPAHGDYDVIEVPQPQTYRPVPVKPLEPISSEVSVSRADNAVSPPPEIEIVSPAHNSWLDNNIGKAKVQIRLTGHLAKRYQLSVYLDDKLLGSTTTYTLENLDRGEHKIRVEITDVAKKKVVRRKRSTFYVRRPSVNQPTGPYPKAGPPMPQYLQQGKNPYHK